MSKLLEFNNVEFFIPYGVDPESYLFIIILCDIDFFVGTGDFYLTGILSSFFYQALYFLGDKFLSVGDVAFF
jgi:hypothetical protein